MQAPCCEPEGYRWSQGFEECILLGQQTGKALMIALSLLHKSAKVLYNGGTGYRHSVGNFPHKPAISHASLHSSFQPHPLHSQSIFVFGFHHFTLAHDSNLADQPSITLPRPSACLIAAPQVASGFGGSLLPNCVGSQS